jgi:hypothetical protein
MSAEKSLPIMILILVIISAAGCSAFVNELRGAPFPEDSFSTGFRSIRSSADSEPASGFSTKARQIEQDLGFR